MKIKNREELIAKQEEYRASLNSQRKQILICAGTGCVAGGSLEIYAKMKDIIAVSYTHLTLPTICSV